MSRKWELEQDPISDADDDLEVREDGRHEIHTEKWEKDEQAEPDCHESFVG